MSEQRRDPTNGLRGEAAIKLVGMGGSLPRSMDPTYSTSTGPYPWDQSVPSTTAPPARPLVEELARRLAEAGAEKAATNPKPPADRASATQPRPSLSEQLRTLMSLPEPAATTLRTSHQGPCRDIVDLAWVQEVREEQAAAFKAELRRRWELLPSGQRIRLLRTTLGWTQGRAATALGITRRTLIRHEQGQHRRPWIRLSLLLRLRELETAHADQIMAYLERSGPVHA